MADPILVSPHIKNFIRIAFCKVMRLGLSYLVPSAFKIFDCVYYNMESMHYIKRCAFKGYFKTFTLFTRVENNQERVFLHWQ